MDNSIGWRAKLTHVAISLGEGAGNIICVRDAAYRVLHRYSADPTPSPPDAGPAVLAALVGSLEEPAGHHIAERAVEAWLSGFRRGAAGPGAYQGQAGIIVGAYAARRMQPLLAKLAHEAAQSLAGMLAARHWPPEELGWEDYDLISGPAGAVLALAIDPTCPAEILRPGARLLAQACHREDLSGLRVRAYREDPLRGWNHNHINTGMAHGVAGVVAALRAAYERLDSPQDLAEPLARACWWLAEQVVQDNSGVLAWSPGGLDSDRRPIGGTQRQAWCYGTPGVAWTLWEAGRVLGSAELQTLSIEAMVSFCAAFQEKRCLHDTEPGVRDSLAFCHGAAGVLMVADAFARHADLAPARALRDRVEGFALRRLNEIVLLAEKRMLLLNGATGTLAALLTVQGGDRAWLTQYGLR